MSLRTYIRALVELEYRWLYSSYMSHFGLLYVCVLWHSVTVVRNVTNEGYGRKILNFENTALH